MRGSREGLPQASRYLDGGRLRFRAKTILRARFAENSRETAHRRGLYWNIMVRSWELFGREGLLRPDVYFAVAPVAARYISRVRVFDSLSLRGRKQLG